ncbi:hypothetical protein PVAND_013392 [Polypedilum vanderplanki]|uniref:Cytochrome P450 n=1 Tax=Polypedilum vanderplanki TaxID=319348 RepID=A0A9J6CQJ8_POLVA|nr:hypothetical protein PVAND_013392 [Polypedilum vanderplanki]
MYNSMLLLFSSNTIYIMITCFILTLILLANELNFTQIKKKMLFRGRHMMEIQLGHNEKKNFGAKQATGPKRKFIIGNLDVLDGYEIPYMAFSDLAQKYGNIFKLQMGTVPSIVVNGLENIREVLIHKGDHFDSRPGFKRYHMLFDGNKENSLAFCDWSDVQKTRRDMLSTHAFPRKFSMSFNRFNDITLEHYQMLSDDIRRDIISGKTTAIKPLIVEACGNVFTQYFTTRSFERGNTKFQQLLKNFDKIFWEVNQGYAADFLPFLLPFHSKRMKKLEQWSHEIRHFIVENIIGDRYETWTVSNEPNDYIESLIDHVKQKLQPTIEWDTALFALEDIIGGHAAVANFLVKVIAFIAQNKEVQKNIQAEVDNLLNERSEKSVLIGDRNKLIYTEATVMEALRLVSSPIVPHVASQDSTIDGFEVKTGTLIFINNYDLNMSTKLWEAPEKFEPKRFISNGRLLKPDHFIPFGNGKRSCMGYKLVQFLSFAILGNLMKDFDISTENGEEIKVPLGSLAVTENPYRLAFTLRN